MYIQEFTSCNYICQNILIRLIVFYILQNYELNFAEERRVFISRNAIHFSLAI